MPKNEDGVFGISGKLQDYGFVFGVLTSSPVGGDICIGVRRRDEQRLEEHYHENANSTFEYIEDKKYNAVIRVSFYVKLLGWREPEDY